MYSYKKAPKGGNAVKKKKILGFGAAFCAGMLSLSACGQQQCSYGPPPSESDSEYSVTEEEVQDVYGPPVAEEDDAQ